MDQMMADQDLERQSDLSVLASTIDEQEIINANLLRQLEVCRKQISRNRIILRASALAAIVLAGVVVAVGFWLLGAAEAIRGHVDALVVGVPLFLLSTIALILAFMQFILSGNPTLKEADYLIEKNRLALKLIRSAMEKGQVSARD